MPDQPGQTLRFSVRLHASEAGAPVRWDADLARLAEPSGDVLQGWIDPDSWRISFADADIPYRADADTLDGRRYTLRFRAPAKGELTVEVTCALRPPPRPGPVPPPDGPVPVVGAGEALRLGTNATVGDLHVGLQTAVDLVDWYGRGQFDLLVTCHLHEGGAFLYASVDGRADDAGRPLFRRQGRLPGFGDDGQGYNGRVRAVDFTGDGRFDLLETRGDGLVWYRNVGAVGAPAFAAPEPLQADGVPLALGARVQSVCPVDLEGDGILSLIVGTNDWSGYWPADVPAWGGKPGYRPYEADGTWRGGPLRGRLFLLRNRGERGVSRFDAPVALCHDDGTPLEVYGLAGPACLSAADPAAGFDLVVSDFLDRLWYFRNTGRPGPDGAPTFFPRTPVRCRGGIPGPLDRFPGRPPAPPSGYPPTERLPDELVLPTCMHALCVAQWPSGEGGPVTDLLIGAEDGYVRALRLVGRTADGVPIVAPPARLQEIGARLSVGAKACPTVVDWDGDGRQDLVLGNAAGQVLLARNTGTDAEPRYEPPAPFVAGDRPLWLMAGAPGTIQGPSEFKWGYINPTVGPWPVPGDTPATAIVCGDALGQNTLYLATDQASGVARTGRGRQLHALRDGTWQPLVTRWRCRPQLADWGDGETVYVQVDEAGNIVRYRILLDGPNTEDGVPRVRALGPLRYADGTPVKLDADTGGHVGRIKLAVTDWDADGKLDLLVGTAGNHPPGLNMLRKATVWLLRNVGEPGAPVFSRPEVLPLDAGDPARFGGHSCVPAPCRLGDAAERAPDLLVGSENGRVYVYRRAYIAGNCQIVGPVRHATGAAR